MPLYDTSDNRGRGKYMNRKWIKGYQEDNVQLLYNAPETLPIDVSTLQGGTWAPEGFAFDGEMVCDGKVVPVFTAEPRDF